MFDMKSGIQIFLAYYLSVFLAAFILNSCASSRTIDPADISQPVIFEGSHMPVLVMQGYSRFPFRRVIVTRDTTYGTAYTAISDTLI
jgi:hypothetical protein